MWGEGQELDNPPGAASGSTASWADHRVQSAKGERESLSRLIWQDLSLSGEYFRSFYAVEGIGGEFDRNRTVYLQAEISLPLFKWHI